ncbi:MAG: pentapeptide repeat-containing protein, partial [Polyangiaceae bacterium]|nr:pentapeptide repeat-containing protein [Polyangiaceae bacterium]
ALHCAPMVDLKAEPARPREPAAGATERERGFRALTERWTPRRVERIVALLREGDREALAAFLDAEVPRVEHPNDPPGSLDLKGISFDALGYRVDLGQARFERVNLWSSRFANVNLKGARFEGCVLGPSSFEKVYLRQSVFAQTDLEGCEFRRANLRGARFVESPLRFASWAECELDVEAFAGGLDEERRGHWGAAAEVYKALRLNLTAAGDDAGAGWAAYRQAVARRRDRRARGRRAAWAYELLVDAIWGYGHKPLRLVGFSIALCLCYAFGYFVCGLGVDRVCTIGPHAASPAAFFADCLYYSFTAFTTAEGGGLSPCNGTGRALAVLNAFSGIFVMGLFVTANVRKLEGR